MRRSFDRLAAMVSHELEEDPMRGDYFLFVNRRASMLKLLYWDGDGFVSFWCRSQQNRSASMIRPASALQNGGLYPILTCSPAFSMISTMKTMFQGWFRAVSTGVCPYHQKSDFLSICQRNRMHPEMSGGCGWKTNRVVRTA